MPLDRRQFLIGVAAVAAASCSSGPSASKTAAGSSTTTRPPPVLSGDPFSLGVASGDPLPDGVVLWTRLAPDPTKADGGMPAGDVDVRWQVATDDAFAHVVAQGVAVAGARLAHAVHVEVSGLRPATSYRYRFVLGDHVSPVGRTRTFPATDATPERFRFAVTSCQDLQFGRYAAWRDVAAASLDAVVFLGDYIYELPPFDLTPEKDGSRTWRNPPPEDLDGYRIRYAQVKQDPALQAAHHAVPWLTMWDDHEVTDNYTGDTSYANPEPVAFHKRRQAAYQAWYEHSPVRLTAPTSADTDHPVYRSFRFGDLVTLPLIETRQYADPTPCRATASNDAGPGCDERLDPDRTLLGAKQLAWLGSQLREASTTWTALGSPVMLSGFDASAGAGAPTYYLESWDGYVAERAKVLDLLDAAKNPVVISGDFHASFVLDACRGPGQPSVAPEFLATAISSHLFDAPKGGNPQVRYAEARNGYMICDVTAARWSVEFRYVKDIWNAASPIDVGPTWVVDAGAREAHMA